MKAAELTDRYKMRIEELLKKLKCVRRRLNIDILSDDEDRELVEGCFVGTVTVLESLYGVGSSQMKALFDAKKAFTKTNYRSTYQVASLAETLRGVLKNTLEELEGDLIRNLITEATGEVIADLVQLAKTELKAGYVSVAAVLASAALEDALKRKATELGIAASGKSLDAIINSLKGRSFFKGAQVPIVASYVKLRNAAMHADWDKLAEADVNSLLGFLEPFLVEHFS